MTIDLYCVGAKNDQLTTCGLVLCASIDGVPKFREFTFNLGKSTSNLADLQAARLALMSIAHKFRHARVILHTPNRYVLSALDKRDGKWTMNAEKHVEEVDSIRDWFGRCKNALVVIDTDASRYLSRAREAAKLALTTRMFTDSGTIDKLVGM